MNKSELINKVATTYNLPAKIVDDIIKSVIYITRNELIKGNKVQLIGFGTFEILHKQARDGRNPRTGEKIIIPAHKTVHFTAGKSLKDAVNQ